MKIPDIDKRTGQDLIHSIQALSAAYTPEWRFDSENPDVGTALALIYAELFEGTIKRFNQTAEKTMLSFFNTVNARLLPAIPATGYVKFGLAGKPLDGVPVEKGTQLVAELPEMGNLIFETCNDLLVSPAEVEDIFYTNGESDVITHVYGEGEGADVGYPLFEDSGENLQQHCLHLCFGDELNIRSEADISLITRPFRQNNFPPGMLEALLDPETAVWEYLSAEGYRPFARQSLEDERFVFHKAAEQPAFERVHQFEAEGYWLRCTVYDARRFRALAFERPSLISRGVCVRPDTVSSLGVQQPLNGCFAFGEKVIAFSDLYFGSTEALSKRGAEITLRFHLSFHKIPIEMDVSDTAINWKLIMRKTQFQPDREYDITVEDVIWEYYNGRGWARLFPDNAYHDIFSTADGTAGVQRVLRFTCPDDIQPFLLDANESCFIRARVLKTNNAFKTRGQYISPYIDEILFDYDYADNPLPPSCLCAHNNMEEEYATSAAMRAPDFCALPFRPLSPDDAALYFGFDVAPSGGPIKMMLSLKGAMRERPPRLTWEYYSARGWKTLNLVDETDNLRRSGIVTFIGARDFESQVLWGRERFWIRAVDATGRYRSQVEELPTLLAIHMNATQVINVETRETEYFSIERRREFFQCKLIHSMLYSVEVWANEVRELDAWKLRNLSDKGLLEPVYNANGELVEAWVKWQEVEDFSGALPDDRFYITDRNEGIITFSDGKNGMIPPSPSRDGIRVVYSTGNGEAGNLAPGQITRTNRSIGFVNEVSNPEITSGGCDQETISQATDRSAAALRHRYRAVSTRDYEWLATEASRNILRSKCFANRDEMGTHHPGSVTLVILQKDFVKGRDFFGALQEQVYQYISRRIAGNLTDLERFHVIAPRFLELHVTVELAVSDFNKVFPVRAAVQERLGIFLDPVSGNFSGNGWEIGSVPNHTQILNCLKVVEGVSFVKSVFVSAYTREPSGLVEADLDRREDWIYALPLSGEHEIEITVG